MRLGHLRVGRASEWVVDVMNASHRTPTESVRYLHPRGLLVRVRNDKARQTFYDLKLDVPTYFKSPLG